MIEDEQRQTPALGQPSWKAIASGAILLSAAVAAAGFALYRSDFPRRLVLSGITGRRAS
jgi:hypothetical protein